MIYLLKTWRFYLYILKQIYQQFLKFIYQITDFSLLLPFEQHVSIPKKLLDFACKKIKVLIRSNVKIIE